MNWSISPEAKEIFEAFKREKGCSQDEAAEAMILEFKRLRAMSPIIGYALERSELCPDGKHHSAKAEFSLP